VAVAGLVQAVCFQWIRLSLLRFYQRFAADGRLPVLLASVGGSFLATSLLVSVVWLAVVLSLDLDAATRSTLLLGLPLTLSQSLFQLSLERHRAALAPRIYGRQTVVRSLLAFALAVFFAWALRLREHGLLLGMALGPLLPTLRDAWLIRRDLARKYFDRGIALDLLRYGFPLALAFAFTFIISMSSRFFIRHILGESPLGLYAVAYDLAAQTLTVVFTLVNIAANPLTIKAVELDSATDQDRQLRQQMSLITGLGLPATAGLAFLAPVLAPLLLGAEYRAEAVAIVPWICLSAFLAGMKATYFDLSFQLSRRTTLQILPVAVGAVVNVLLNLLLIPRYGLDGAVISTVSCMALALAISVALGRRAIRLPIPWLDLGKIAAATAIMLGTIVWIPRAMSWLYVAAILLLAATSFAAACLALDVADSRRTIKRMLATRSL
jgi:O-antigen/teichoic acid export membrane protein